MLLSTGAILLGFALLIWGADRFVIGASALARNLGVPPLLIGLTIVGFGTSAPEILVSGVASLQGNPGLAIGNALGSNIANIGLILGATALVVPLMIDSDVLRKELPMLLVITMGSMILLADQRLDRIDGLLLISALLVSSFLVIKIGISRQKSDELAQEFNEEIPVDLSTAAAVGIFLLGLVVLLVGSKVLVAGAVEIARGLGVSDLVIGLTIVAIGTSLPELAASIASALKNEHALAVGNIIGSNMYNLLAVLPIPGLFAPGMTSPEVMQRDMPVLLGLTVALFLLGRGRSGKGLIGRVQGLILLFVFAGYQYWIYYTTVNP